MTILPSPSLLNKINEFIFAKKEEKFSLNYGLFLLGWKSGLRVNEAISFDYHLKHPRHKNLYLVHGKGNKTRYVYVSPAVISELKFQNWKPNQTTRFAFNNFLKKVKEKLNVPANVGLTPHTLRRCFTTYNALNGVPLPILQKSLGHVNIRTTSGYWKGSVDIGEFGGWLEPDSSPKEPKEIPKVKVDNNSQLPKPPKLPLKLENPSPDNSKEPELLKTIEKLKRELAERDKQLKVKDHEISLLTNENKKLKTINQEKDRQLLSFAETLNKVELEKDRQLKELQEKIRQLKTKNNLSIQNCTNLKNPAKNTDKIQVNNNQTQIKPLKEKNIRKILFNSRENLSNALLKIKKPQNNSLVVKKKPQTELSAQIQVWKPPN